MPRRILKNIETRINELASGGKSLRKIAEIVGVSTATVSRVISRAGKNTPKPIIGRPRVLDKHDEKYIGRLATTGKCSTSTEIQQELKTYAGISASSSTILRTLKRSNIISRYKKKCPQLKKSHRRARSGFEKTHRNWENKDWDMVIWSDETKVNLQGSDGRERTFRKIGEPLRDHNITQTKKFGGGSIMVWGCMLSSGVGYLCRIDGGVNAEIYEGILDDELMHTIDWYGLDKSNIIFQNDNASSHTASSIKKWFKRNEIKVMTWPAQSPDLNPIEHLWDHMKRELKNRPPSKDKDELWEKIQDIWNNIPAEVCLNLVRSMPRRLEQIRKSKGGHTIY